MVIDFSVLIYTLLALYTVGGILIAAALGLGVWSIEKYLNRQCEEIQRQEARQGRVPAQFAKPLAKAGT